MKSRAILLFGLILSFQFSFAHNSVIDSLQVVLKETTVDSTKINILNELAWEYRRSDINKMVQYCDKALKLSKSTYYLRGECRATYNLAVAAISQGDNEKALQYDQTALNIARQIDDKNLLASTINVMGALYFNKGDMENALYYYQQTLKYAEISGNTRMQCVAYYNIGLLYNAQDNKRKAMEYFHRSAAIGISSGNASTLAMSYQSMGTIYLERKQYDAAMEYFEKALEISTENKDEQSCGTSIMEIGILYAELGDYQTAVQNLNGAYEIFKKIGKVDVYPYVLNSLAGAYYKMGKYSKGKEIGEECLKMALKLNLRSELPHIYKNLADNCSGTEDYKEAYIYYKRYDEGQDSLASNVQNELIAEMESKYQMQKKETENQLLKEKQAYQESTIRSKSYMTLTAILFLLLAIGAALVLYKSNQQKKGYNLLLKKEVAARTNELQESNDALRKSNEELEHFTYIASHDLKEPLRNITGFCKLIERKLKDDIDPSVAEYLGFVRRNALQMHSLVQDVLEFSQISKKKKNNFVSVDTSEVMEQIKLALDSTIKQKNAEIQYENLPVVLTNSTQLYLVLKNLITNGMKYNTSPVPVIQVSYERQFGKHVFGVKDNGIGIEKEYHNQIFGMFKRLHNREKYQGSGLGLAICKKIVDTMGGDIWVESIASRGSVFYFSFSAGQDGSEGEMLNTEQVNNIAISAKA